MAPSTKPSASASTTAAATNNAQTGGAANGSAAPPNANGSTGGLGLSASSSSTPLGLPFAGAPTSVYPTDTVRDVAESLGIANFKDNVAAALAADVEYRIREIVQDATKFMRHSKRDQLKTSDIDAALRGRNIEPLYGFLPSSAGRLATSRYTAGPSFRKVQTASGVPLHYVEDEEIDFDKILEAGPRIGVGKGVGWGAHWLAIEGVQPALPQNPSPADLAEVVGPVGFAGPVAAQTTAAAPAAKAVAVAGTGAGDAQAVAKPLVKHILSRELQLYYERLTKAIVSPPPEADEDFDDADDDNDNVDDRAGVASGKGTDDMDIDDEEQKGIVTPPRPGAAPALPLKTFEKKGSGNRVRDAALASLRGDPGLHQLVPYLVQFVGGKVIEILRGGAGQVDGAELDRLHGGEGREISTADNHMLSVMLSTVHAVLVNPHIFVEPYLHQMMPSILSILLTTSLAEPGLDAQSTHEIDNPLITAGPSSYSLRAYASALLAHIVEKHGPSYPSLKPRIVTTLLKALLAGALPDAGPTTASTQTSSVNGGDPHHRGRSASRALSADRTGAGRPGPRPEPGTKVGAIMGLRRLGKASFKVLLQGSLAIGKGEGQGQGEDESEPKCPLFLLGGWMQAWEEGDHNNGALSGSDAHGDGDDEGRRKSRQTRERQLRPILREITGGLHALLPPFVPTTTEVTGTDEERTAALQRAYGAYWMDRVIARDGRARIALEIEAGLRGTALEDLASAKRDRDRGGEVKTESKSG
ncbi:uncharacterized protein PFL1_06455 [Pseudozyma flocculosa PF-1]|uniref:TBP-associated factor 6 n=2 Tax=Pseudozyma flocculosa TaxID=84751 RepID=A0A5C3EVC2_9BASI|nr:uncharacterized protein PFL1_06455 [Pseudozyma flocculosa PF-1]EPQ26001.1 hypothetical protein PFL1_06455 [Pseudozyma flocculosa PF-1]SPO35695.1 related to TAF6 - Subunit (60 kDa) of TFIID and SAGA complexes [Pseudozyma flocculosa]